jgi:hypothetical protein
LAVHGLACVSEGRVAEGMRLLDEAVAAATGREITDPQWYYFACCCMIDACDRVRDFSRSFAWCEQLREFAERWRVQAFLTTCRVKYTAALLWRGEWRAYEEQLEQAISEMTATRPGGWPSCGGYRAASTTPRRFSATPLRTRSGFRYVPPSHSIVAIPTPLSISWTPGCGGRPRRRGPSASPRSS